jgi:hypothetical protein
MLCAATNRPASETTWQELETFNQCRRRFRLELVERAGPEFEPVERFMDRTVHDALSWLLKAALRGDTVRESALVERFQSRWTETLTPRVRVIRAGDRIEAYAHRGEMMLRRFHHDWSGAGLRPEAVGRQFRLRLFGRFELLLEIDLVARDRHDGLHVVDFGSGPRPRGDSDPGQVLRLRTAGLAVLLNWKLDRVTLVRHLLADGRKLTEDYTRQDAVPLVSALAARLEEIEGASEYPVRPSLKCAWCPYRRDCEDSGFPTGFVPLTESELGRCPKCAAQLGLRHGRLGVFVTCARYPDCRYSRDL